MVVVDADSSKPITEVDLMNMQAQNNRGIFECEGNDIFKPGTHADNVKTDADAVFIPNTSEGVPGEHVQGRGRHLLRDLPIGEAWLLRKSHGGLEVSVQQAPHQPR